LSLPSNFATVVFRGIPFGGPAGSPALFAHHRKTGKGDEIEGKGVTMAKTHEGFSFKEHQRIGKQILKLRQQLKGLDQKVSGAYGKSSRCSTLTKRLLKDLAFLQNELNEKLCRENPESGKLELLACYYPKEG
jgi:hypothetical protein